jgi:zinc protease
MMLNASSFGQEVKPGLVAAESAQSKSLADAAKVDYTEETLDNGLKVIYAPMGTAPIVHVRVLYNVGSKDERQDRQGFAHMFEHMMFRGSQHVAPEEHMKLVTRVGGNSNAFTTVDETTYIQTLPSSHLEMALWLEADRMSSFKVSDEIFQTERKVVAEEWRMRYGNPPTGTMFLDFYKLAFSNHPYRWTAIGDMDQLRQAASSELQEFFNKYYVPNNATLVIAGKYDVEQAKAMVRKYFGWIPKGPDIDRSYTPEPEQTEPRQLTVYRKNVPLPTMIMGYKTADYKSDDHVALDALGDILGGRTRTSRLNRMLVNPPVASGEKPVALQAWAGDDQRQALGMFMVGVTMLPGQDPDAIEKRLLDAINDLATQGPTVEELERYKVQSRRAIISARESVDDVATALSRAEAFAGDTRIINRELGLIEALKVDDIKAMAVKYLQAQRRSVVRYVPDPTGEKAHAAGQADSRPDPKKADETGKAPVVASTQKVEPRSAPFPAGYPTQPPTAEIPNAKYNLGTVGEVNGVQVVTITDHRLPLATFSLVMRTGGDAEPAGKEGVAGLTAAMMRRGTNGVESLALSQLLESRGVSVEVDSGADTTSVSGGGTSDQLEFAVEQAALVLGKPDFPEGEFVKVKNQAIQGLRRSLADGAAVVERQLDQTLWTGTPMGRLRTVESLSSITLDDVKAWYDKAYRKGSGKGGAFLIFAGDVAPEKALKLAEKLTAVLKDGDPVRPAYEQPDGGGPAKRQIILVDNAEGRQTNILVGFRTYNIFSTDRFAGNVASQVLSSGIDARMMRYLRAERGLTYGARGIFSPRRSSGEFVCSTDTNPATSGASVEGIFTVLEKMRTEDITDEELSGAKSRAAGSAIMATQTLSQQAMRRAETILNGWPADYYEKSPSYIAAVTKEQVREVMKKYANPDNAVIVVVGPAATVKEQLEKFGTVEVVPMPMQAGGPAAGGK